jgi:hypothetical protein
VLTDAACNEHAMGKEEYFYRLVTIVLCGVESVTLLPSQTIFVMRHEYVVTMNAGECTHIFVFFLWRSLCFKLNNT